MESRRSYISITLLRQSDLLEIFLTTSLQSICILRLSAIGDVCHAVAAVQAIQKQHPDAKITWIIGKIEFQLLQGLPGVEFVIFEKNKGKAAYKDLASKLDNRQFDVLLHMQVAFRANWATRFIKAKLKIGFDWGRAKELHALFTRTRIKSQNEPHVLEGFFAFAEKIGVPETALQHLSWNIPVSDVDTDFAKSVIADNERHFVIAPAASKAERNWLPERYAALAIYAVEQGFKVSLCGGPGPLDRKISDLIIDNFNNYYTGQNSAPVIQDLVGKTTLKQMLAILSRASLVIAPDTGPAHMAVTQRTPVLGLYAHSNPKRTGPYLYQDYVSESYHQHIKTQQGKPANELKWGVRAKGKNLMADIDVETVKKNFNRIVKDFSL